ncbi:XtrA/YqaO family protein [Halalkalibacterium halodurans]|uniref:XtrA/YqaO family protein n=1 Tax=Halalkalibacterium halodurans TaxID=86665 RepID=UPI002E22E0CC|nr:XtrA/YqaO family protein [Halalkalibacterium halodurans]
MRLKNVEINPQSGKIEVDIMEYIGPFVVVVSDGRVKVTELPAHGETKVITHQGKVKRIRFDEGEEL